MASRTPGKWLVIRKSDGEVFERWPIDAKEMVGTGDYELDPNSVQVPEGLAKTVAPGEDPVPHLKAAQKSIENSPEAQLAAKVRAEQEAKEEAEAGTWPLATPPDEYLKRWPDGPKADLAKSVLGQD